MKKLTGILLAALLFLSITGCQNETEIQNQISDTKNTSALNSEISENNEPSNEETDDNNFLNEIVDKDGKHIGEIKINGSCTMTNKGIFYTTVKNAPPSDTVTVGANGKSDVYYHLYDIETNQTYDFGNMPEQDYEAGYVRTEMNDKLYTLVTTGNALDNIPDPLILLEFDLTEHSMKQYKISDNGFPYTAMTAANGNLLILNHDQTQQLYDKVYMFDTDTKEVSQVLQFELTDNKGDTIRQIYSDEKNIYILRLHFEDESHVNMFVDTYDFNFKKQYENDISSMLKESVEKELVSEDVLNEMKQMASRFIMLDGKYIYYENFSATRFFGNIENKQLFNEINGMSLASFGSGKPFFYYIYGERTIFEWKNNTLEKSVLKTDDERYYIVSASISENGKKLIQVDYTNPNDNSDTLPTKLYCI